MSEFAKRPSTEADDSVQHEGEALCEVTAIQKPVTGDSVAPVSPSVSPAAPLSNGREQLITETTDTTHQSGSQHGNGNTKANCYECKHQWGVAGSAHSSCRHPAFSAVNADPVFQVLALLRSTQRQGLPSIESEECKVVGNAYGIKMGWFMHPLNFDPVWLESCTGFERK